MRTFFLSRRFEAIEIIEARDPRSGCGGHAGAGTRQHVGWKTRRAVRRANRLRVTAEGLATLAGQERIYDSDTFNSWLAAKLDGKRSGGVLRARFARVPPAFTAWLGTDPFNNAQAPPGPIFMPEYHNAKHEQFFE